MSALQTQLEQALAQLELTLSDEQVAKLMQYLELLQKWNKVYNLTAIRDPQEMLVKHIFDSLAVVSHIEAERIIDVGTGGGLPGIPLAICRPEMQVHLLDSNSKKTRFLIQAKAELKLENVQVLHQRVESYQPEPPYDGVISRAFASLEDMLTWTHNLLPINGTWWAMKAQKEVDELDRLPGYAQIDRVIDLQVPQLNADRRLIKITKTAHA